MSTTKRRPYDTKKTKEVGVTLRHLGRHQMINKIV